MTTQPPPYGPQPPQYGPPQPPPPYGPPQPRPNWFARHKLLTGVGIGVGSGLAVAAVVVALLATASGSESPADAESSAGTTTAIQDIADTCQVKRLVGDEGHSMTMDTGLDGESTIADVACVVYGLDMPDSMVARMDSTNSLMGMQTGTWDEYRASWSYHPDNGLLLIIEER